jgi:hypothetical protein
MDEKFEAKFDAMDEKFDARFDATGERIDRVEDVLGRKIDHQGRRIDGLESDVRATTRQLFGGPTAA